MIVLETWVEKGRGGGALDPFKESVGKEVSSL